MSWLGRRYTRVRIARRPGVASKAGRGRGHSVSRGRYGLAVPPLPRITGRELVLALVRLGWVVVVQRGSHVQLKHPSRGGRVTVPIHASEVIGPALLRSV